MYCTLANKRIWRPFWEQSAWSEPQGVFHISCSPEARKGRRAFDDGYGPAVRRRDPATRKRRKTWCGRRRAGGTGMGHHSGGCLHVSDDKQSESGGDGMICEAGGEIKLAADRRLHSRTACRWDQKEGCHVLVMFNCWCAGSSTAEQAASLQKKYLTQRRKMV